MLTSGKKASPGCGMVRPSMRLVFLLSAIASTTLAADFEDVRQRFLEGKYAECLELTENSFSEDRWILRLQTLLVLGRYPDAKSELQTALDRYRASIRLRQLGHEIQLRNGDTTRARLLLGEVTRMVGQAPWRYSDAKNLLSLGKVALSLGADSREVLENFYDRSKERDPQCREAYLAIADLGFEKHDDAVAAQVLKEGLEKFAEDPDFHFGLARALGPRDHVRAKKHLQQALELNPNHVAALLYLAEHHIDSERYDQAEAKLAQVLKINPWHRDAWALRAVLAHLRTDLKGERVFRAMALRYWNEDPAACHLIGKKLSQKYRFEEGAAYQRMSLWHEPNYLPAKAQLAQDLLRLGQEEEGWELTDEVYQRDGYDVVAFNLINLRESIEKFRTLRNENFLVRMDAHEAQVYGRRVLALLGRARRVLCKKYGMRITEPVTVEIFPDQSDFAVRTFGIPGGSGYLGVCFGKVITANSPAALPESTNNWEAVLWHEFCHVVTLELTTNKIPRWLSEGISVYEEKQANPAWGQSMTPRYRSMILGGELTPVGSLSAAFLSPKSGLHLQFAYYESSLVVEFLVDRFGLDSLGSILRDLGVGMTMEETLSRHTGWPLEQLEKKFEVFAIAKAEELAPEGEWDHEELAKQKKLGEKELLEWLDEHPNSMAGLTEYARLSIGKRNWTEAKKPLGRLIELYPGSIGVQSPYRLLARVHRELKETEQERAVLEELAELDADARDCYLRLLELQSAAADWRAVRQTTDRLLAVDPLIPEPHWFRGRALEKLEQPIKAIESYETLLFLDPADPVAVHYRLARLLDPTDHASAKRHLLLALESAPRFRDAHRLLLKMHRRGNPKSKILNKNETRNGSKRF